MTESEGSPTTSWFEQQTTGSSSVEQVLQLGRQLASSLDEHDILGHWLAQYIAELITTYEAEDGEARAVAGRRAAKAVLKLWKHRRYRTGRRPLQSYEAVMAGLARIGGETAWGIEGVLRANGLDAGQLASLPLLRSALSLEQTVHEIVLGAIVVAAEEAEYRESAWLDATAGLKQDAEELAIHRIRTKVGRLRKAHPLAMLGELNGAESEEESEHNDAAAHWLRANTDAAAKALNEIRLALEAIARNGSGTSEDP